MINQSYIFTPPALDAELDAGKVTDHSNPTILEPGAGDSPGREVTSTIWTGTPAPRDEKTSFTDFMPTKAVLRKTSTDPGTVPSISTKLPSPEKHQSSFFDFTPAQTDSSAIRIYPAVTDQLIVGSLDKDKSTVDERADDTNMSDNGVFSPVITETMQSNTPETLVIRTAFPDINLEDLSVNSLGQGSRARDDNLLNVKNNASSDAKNFSAKDLSVNIPQYTNASFTEDTVEAAKGEIQATLKDNSVKASTSNESIAPSEHQHLKTIQSAVAFQELAQLPPPLINAATPTSLTATSIAQHNPVSISNLIHNAAMSNLNLVPNSENWEITSEDTITSNNLRPQTKEVQPRLQRSTLAPHLETITFDQHDSFIEKKTANLIQIKTTDTTQMVQPALPQTTIISSSANLSPALSPLMQNGMSIRGPSGQSVSAINTLPMLENMTGAVSTVTQALSRTTHNQKGITVRLDPPEMGRVYIEFQFDGERNISAVIRAELSDIASHLKDNSVSLQSILKNSGFDEVSLSFEQQDAESMDMRGQSEGQQNHNLSNTQYHVHTNAPEDDSAPPQLNEAPYWRDTSSIDIKL